MRYIIPMMSIFVQKFRTSNRLGKVVLHLLQVLAGCYVGKVPIPWRKWYYSTSLLKRIFLFFSFLIFDSVYK